MRFAREGYTYMAIAVALGAIAFVSAPWWVSVPMVVHGVSDLAPAADGRRRAPRFVR